MSLFDGVCVYKLTDDRAGPEGKERKLRHVMVYAIVTGSPGQMHLGAGVFTVEPCEKKGVVWGPKYKKRMMATAKGRATKCPLVLHGSFRKVEKGIVHIMADGTTRSLSHKEVCDELIRPAVLVNTDADIPSLAVRGPRI